MEAVFKPMTPEQEAHLRRIKETFSALCEAKYRRGQNEHGGDLHLKDGLLDMAIEEVIDLTTYLFSMKEQQTSLVKNRGQVLLWDMDNTLCKGISWTPEDCLRAEPNLENIEKVNALSKNHFIIIYTARRDENIPATLEWLRRNNIRFHAISNTKIGGLYVDSENLRPSDV